MADNKVAVEMMAARADLHTWVADFLRVCDRNLEIVEEEDMASVIAAGALHYASLAHHLLGNMRAYSHCRLAELCLLARKDTSVYRSGLKDLEEAQGVARQLTALAQKYKQLSVLGTQVGADSASDGRARGASIEVYEAAVRGLVEQMKKELEGEEGELVEIAGAFEMLGSRVLEAAAEINWRRRDLPAAIACWASLVVLDGIEEEFNLMQRIQPGYCDLMSKHLQALADSYLLSSSYDWLFTKTA